MDASELEQLLRGWSTRRDGNLSVRLSVALRQLIHTGLLLPGLRLPAERQLAAALAVSRPTVTSALDDLRRQGLLKSQQGSGSWIAASDVADGPSTTPFSELLLTERGINLAGAYCFDASHLPAITLSTADLLAASPAHGIAPLGLDRLRSAAARRMTQAGLHAKADQIVITAGAHQALRLTLETLIQPGDRIVIDEYSYGGLIGLAQRHQATLVGVPSDEHGVEPSHLDRAIATSHPALVAVGSTIQSPTGQQSTDERTRDLAQVLNNHGRPVLIDETLAELHYQGRPAPLAVQLTCPTIVVESMSKSAWTGLRTGWIYSSSHLKDRIAEERYRFDLGLPVAGQLIAACLLDVYDEFLTLRRRALATRAEQLHQLIADHLPKWAVQPPAGGLTTWIRTPFTDADRFVAIASQRGISIVPGSACHHQHQPSPYVRICHDRPSDLLTRAITRLAQH